jgi:hypothetical protein
MYIWDSLRINNNIARQEHKNDNFFKKKTEIILFWINFFKKIFKINLFKPFKIIAH